MEFVRHWHSYQFSPLAVTTGSALGHRKWEEMDPKDTGAGYWGQNKGRQILSSHLVARWNSTGFLFLYSSAQDNFQEGNNENTFPSAGQRAYTFSDSPSRPYAGIEYLLHYFLQHNSRKEIDQMKYLHIFKHLVHIAKLPSAQLFCVTLPLEVYEKPIFLCIHQP